MVIAQRKDARALTFDFFTPALFYPAGARRGVLAQQLVIF
jgi:hypothetical protein